MNSIISSDLVDQGTGSEGPAGFQPAFLQMVVDNSASAHLESAARENGPGEYLVQQL